MSSCQNRRDVADALIAIELDMKMGRPPRKTSDWIAKAKLVHGSTYDYSHSVYLGSHEPITIVCATHGAFIQRASKHLEGRGCKKCVVDSSKKSDLEFVRDAKLVHGDFYDYSRVALVSTHKPVTIICPIHGEFQQLPVKHQSGQGCKKCGIGEVWSREDFLREAKKVHGDHYDYHRVRYTRTADPVDIHCNECGKMFAQRPNAHLRGAGCPYCAGTVRYSDDTFRELLSETHNGEIVSLEDYNGSGNPIRVRHICGYEWTTTPNRVVTQRKGCKKCVSDRLRMTEEVFLQRLHVRHNGEIVALDKYKQSKIRIRVRHLKCGKVWSTEPRNVLRCGCHDCANRKTDSEFRDELREVHNDEIVALEAYETVRQSILVRHKCGKEWRVNPVDLISKGTGCPWCATSHGNKEITKILTKHNFTFSAEARFETCRHKIQLPFDFHLTEHKVLIEFDGQQHFEAVEFWGGEAALQERKKRDAIKNTWAKANGFQLYRIRYDDDLDAKMMEIVAALVEKTGNSA
jgi:very-short-patch-repair endonuclease